MSDWPSRFVIARWEFKRFIKPNQLAISFVMMLVLGAVGFGVGKWAERSDAKTVRVAVIGGSALGMVGIDTVNEVILVPAAGAELDSLRAALVAQKLAGILVVQNVDSAQLIVRRNPAWRRTLETHLATERRRLQLAGAGIGEQQLARLLAPVAVTTEFQGGNDGRAARTAATISVGLVLYGLFMSMAYMLVSVTAEKQLRVTEQVVSAISPQTWIDGKILGLSAVAFVNVALAVASGMVWIFGNSLATGEAFSMGSVEFGTLLLILLFALLGFLFWLSLFSAVAATIDDPNSSTRGPLMFLPALFSVAGFLVVRIPDSTFARITGLIPLTSSSVMPARLAMTEVPAWEIALSALLLLGGAWLARRTAGKVFAVAMLMYGKEPSWGEVRRWAREG
jgi:ABC-2 type transport system permease protein